MRARAQFLRGKPKRAQDPLIEGAFGPCTHIAGNSKAHIRNIVASMMPSVYADQCPRLKMVSAFLQRLTARTLQDGLTRFEMASRLVDANPLIGKLFDHEKTAILFQYRCNGHADCGHVSGAVLQRRLKANHAMRKR